MTRRKDPTKPARAYHAFPWTERARLHVFSLAFPMCRGCKSMSLGDGKPCPACGEERTAPAVSLRTISAELVSRGLVDRRPSAAAVRRLVLSLRADMAVRS